MKVWQQAMIALARSERITNFVQQQPRLQGLSRRFVGGVSTEDGIATASDLRQRGMAASMFFLGEYVKDPVVIEATINELTKIMGLLLPNGIDVNVSVDPTQLGLMIDEATCTSNIEMLAMALQSATGTDAPHHGHDALMIDMEDASVAGYTLDLHNRLLGEGLPVAVTVQAYLHRTLEDLEVLAAHGSWVRLVKGAFAEPGEIAARRRKDIDSLYRRAVATLMSPAAHEAGCYPAFGTHDDVIIEEILAMADRFGWDPNRFEFEMLLGVRPELQQSLADRGYRVRLYIPFGQDWFPYAIRRVGESPRNLRFAASAVAKSRT